GAENRHALVKNFDQSLALARRYGRPLSVIMFDVDHFKTVNDVHGHTVGDEVLVKLVDLCRKELRKADHLARWGGDEFFILLPETPGESALEVAERIRHKVPVLFEEKPYTVTLSMGVYQVPVEKISSADQAFAEVDKALYRAKEKGRNRVERA
ncbi:MAG TPA: GGDEF domain-containing protein, partial [Synergistaceae bacterium]|nr:GGDEF domain-containing protein [Synergistaceae bacterium]